MWIKCLKQFQILMHPAKLILLLQHTLDTKNLSNMKRRWFIVKWDTKGITAVKFDTPLVEQLHACGENTAQKCAIKGKTTPRVRCTQPVNEKCAVTDIYSTLPPSWRNHGSRCDFPSHYQITQLLHLIRYIACHILMHLHSFHLTILPRNLSLIFKRLLYYNEMILRRSNSYKDWSPPSLIILSLHTMLRCIIIGWHMSCEGGWLYWRCYWGISGWQFAVVQRHCLGGQLYVWIYNRHHRQYYKAYIQYPNARASHG